jgi:tyrosinase
MHTAQSIAQAHGDRGFLPWHRAYLLDLERELQGIDPQVTLPYWRFDRDEISVQPRGISVEGIARQT